MTIRTHYFRLILIVSATLWLARAGLAEEPRWQASQPSLLKDTASWKPFLEHLLAKNMNYGAMAASYRMLIFFSDINSKELAYKTIIKIIDRGYPFSAQQAFLSGDIQPQEDYDFTNSYNLYKAILNQKSGSDRWAANYFANVDKEGFPKYLFYLALESYSKNDFPKAEELLKKIFTKDAGDVEKLPFIRKVARSLARIYFDQEQYEKSLDIYSSFLLKLNPMSPSDWIETAWNLYHLKRYNEALGIIYNLESRANDGNIDLEKYTIRALTYKELCAGTQAEILIQSFERDFGSVIQGIKRGESLNRFPILNSIYVPQNEQYRQIQETIAELKSEMERIQELSRVDQLLSNYIYGTELRAQQRRVRFYQDKATEDSASSLVMLSEQLKFLRYDVAREKFNPDHIFKPTVETKHELIENFESTYTLHWIQFGDYWRDERGNFKGTQVNQCMD